MGTCLADGDINFLSWIAIAIVAWWLLYFAVRLAIADALKSQRKRAEQEQAAMTRPGFDVGRRQ